jgi:hypothetical protein
LDIEAPFFSVYPKFLGNPSIFLVDWTHIPIFIPYAQNIHHYMGMGEKMYALYPIVQTAPESECKNVPDRVNTPETYFLIKNIGCPL